MQEITNKHDKLAVLIDADNANGKSIGPLLTEMTRYGAVHVKRAYGNWTTPLLAPWKEALHKYAIQPMQQFAYTSGKNSTDSALIIDAIDLLYTQNFDGFCIVSSDSDFTRLATRLRESGLKVYGFGEQKTPEAFQKACDKFIYVENLLKTKRQSKSEGRQPRELIESQDNQKDMQTEPQNMSQDELGYNLHQIFKQAIDDCSEYEGEWTYLGQINTYILKNHPNFDPRNHECEKIGELVKSKLLSEIIETRQEGSAFHIRLKH